MAWTKQQQDFIKILKQKWGAVQATEKKLATQTEELSQLAESIKTNHFPGEMDEETRQFFRELQLKMLRAKRKTSTVKDAEEAAEEEAPVEPDSPDPETADSPDAEAGTTEESPEGDPE
jgi:hypothetical protein